MNRIRLALAAAALAAGAAIAFAQSDGGTRIELRVWESASDPARNFVSARAEGGSWADLGTVPVTMDGVSASGAYRYGDLTLPVAHDEPLTPAEARELTELRDRNAELAAQVERLRAENAELRARPTPTPAPAPRVCEFDEASVRRAVVRRSNGASAFHVGGGYFLTAAHTFGGAVTGEGWSSPVRTMGEDYVLDRDVELLRASEAPDGLPALRPAARVAVGDFVAIVTTRETARGVVTKHWTYSVQKPVRDKDGRVVWYEDRPDLDFPVLNTDMDLGKFSGSSGAPVVNECGEVVAVVSASCPNDGCAENPGVFDGAMRERIPPWR